MQTILRERCAVTGSADLEPLHNVRNAPVFMGCVGHAVQDDIVADMDWWISRSSGLVQLRRLLPLEVVYAASHAAGAVGAVWARHHRSFARFVHHGAPAAVLEIGGAHGILALEYQQLAAIAWTIVEPNPEPAPGCAARFIKGFFDASFSFEQAVDAVVHSHLFEHIYEPDQFMAQLGAFMTPGQQLVFSLPNMQAMLERHYTNAINFEHTVLLTEPYVEHLLAKHGFQLLDKEYFMEDHSIFYRALRADAVAPQPLPSGLYDQNRRLYLDFLDYHERLIAQLNARLRAASGPVYLFGAHIFAQSLIGFGLDTTRIVCLLDNAASKQGRRLYGSTLMVHAPALLRGVPDPLVILKAGMYNEEIKKDILDNINPSTVFLE